MTDEEYEHDRVSERKREVVPMKLGPSMFDREDAVYREIGKYVVTFSELVGTMRTHIEAWLAGPSDDKRAVVSLAMGTLTAQELADPFFAVCRAIGNLDHDEQRVERLLREKVNHEIRERNRIAHGDWEIVSLIEREDGTEQHTPSAKLRRVKPGSVKDPILSRSYEIAELERITESMWMLSVAVNQFGNVCLRDGWRVSTMFRLHDGGIVMSIEDDEWSDPF